MYRLPMFVRFTSKLWTVLTLSYSSKGSPALAVFRHHKLSYANYTWMSIQPPSCILWSRIGLYTRPQSAFTAFRALLSSAQTIPLSDLVRCDSLLQIVMAVWRAFLKIWSAPKSHYCQQQASVPNIASSIFFKVPQTAITICSGLSHPTGWAALPSENISWCFFFKGGETLWGYNTVFISDVYERVNNVHDVKKV
jgi:hypothetical protein